MMSDDIHICFPEPIETKTVEELCPTCNKATRFVVQDYEYYSSIMICLECGEEFGEEGRKPRPFRRFWREKNIERANRMIERAK